MHPTPCWAHWRCSADTHTDTGHTLTSSQQSELPGFVDKQKAEEPPSWNQGQAASPTRLPRPRVGAKVLETFRSAMNSCINGRRSPGACGRLELREGVELTRRKNFHESPRRKRTSVLRMATSTICLIFFSPPISTERI